MVALSRDVLLITTLVVLLSLLGNCHASFGRRRMLLGDPAKCGPMTCKGEEVCCDLSGVGIDEKQCSAEGDCINFGGIVFARPTQPKPKPPSAVQCGKVKCKTTEVCCDLSAVGGSATQCTDQDCAAFGGRVVASVGGPPPRTDWYSHVCKPPVVKPDDKFESDVLADFRTASSEFDKKISDSAYKKKMEGLFLSLSDTKKPATDEELKYFGIFHHMWEHGTSKMKQHYTVTLPALITDVKADYVRLFTAVDAKMAEFVTARFDSMIFPTSFDIVWQRCSRFRISEEELRKCFRDADCGCSMFQPNAFSGAGAIISSKRKYDGDIIEFGLLWFNYPAPAQAFILGHEIGHTFIQLESFNFKYITKFATEEIVINEFLLKGMFYSQERGSDWFGINLLLSRPSITLDDMAQAGVWACGAPASQNGHPAGLFRIEYMCKHPKLKQLVDATQNLKCGTLPKLEDDDVDFPAFPTAILPDKASEWNTVKAKKLTDYEREAATAEIKAIPEHNQNKLAQRRAEHSKIACKDANPDQCVTLLTGKGGRKCELVREKKPKSSSSKGGKKQKQEAPTKKKQQQETGSVAPSSTPPTTKPKQQQQESSAPEKLFTCRDMPEEKRARYRKFQQKLENDDCGTFKAPYICARAVTESGKQRCEWTVVSTAPVDLSQKPCVAKK